MTNTNPNPIVRYPRPPAGFDTNGDRIVTVSYPLVSAMRAPRRTETAIAGSIVAPMFAGFHTAATTAYVWNGDTVTFARRNVMRTIPADHPAAVHVVTAIDGGTAVNIDDAFRGRGRGHARVEHIGAGHTTATGRARVYRCGGYNGMCHNHRHGATPVPVDDAAPMPVDAFPTYGGAPRADGATHNVAACRACRDARCADNRAARNGGSATIDAPTAVNVTA